MIDNSHLPTHIARAVTRFNIVGQDASADTFLITSYISESILKTLVIALCASVRKSSPASAYRFEYEIVRSSGLGSWESTLSSISSHAYVGYVTQELQPIVAWVTRKRTRAEDKWARDAVNGCIEILKLLGITDNEVPRVVTMRHLISQLVQIRNKTKAHGAVGPDFFRKANSPYVNLTKLILENLPILDWDWFYFSWKRSDSLKAVKTIGNSPFQIYDTNALKQQVERPGIYFRTHACGTLFSCDPLIITNEECSSFHVPNGGITDTGFMEYIDYFNGNIEYFDAAPYLTPPAPLPASITEGIPSLDIFANVFGNLPQIASDYVERHSLQEELMVRLNDKNHTIITLHGRGGVGKTSLALYVAHQVANEESPPFEYIVWLSARDLELKISGPTEVRRAVSNIDKICQIIGGLFGIETSNDSFAALLQSPSCIKARGILFIFDNFETLDDPRGIHQFLDTHTHIPNKVLITSRERAFKGDFPIEVGGMETDEAMKLIKNQASILGIESILNEDRTEEIISYTNGHAYVIRVLLGEIAKESVWIPIKSLVPRRTDLLNAIFERSFNKMSNSGRLVFLTIGSWRSLFSEWAILAVVGMRDIDVESGIDECLRLSLINRHELSDGTFCYSVPELAHLFAKKKLDGDPDRLLILEDMSLLQQFGQIKPSELSEKNIGDILSKFMVHSSELAYANLDQRLKLESIMVRVSELWPNGWLYLADYKKRAKAPKEDIGYALRRAVEEMPYNKLAWIKRADFAAEQGEDALLISSLVSAVEADPTDFLLISRVAKQLNDYIHDHKDEIPPARRGVYLANVRSYMERVSPKLSATGLARLAWLFLHEGNEKDAWKYANQGLTREPTNEHCLKLVEKLRPSMHSLPDSEK